MVLAAPASTASSECVAALIALDAYSTAEDIRVALVTPKTNRHFFTFSGGTIIHDFPKSFRLEPLRTIPAGQLVSFKKGFYLKNPLKFLATLTLFAVTAFGGKSSKLP